MGDDAAALAARLRKATKKERAERLSAMQCPIVSPAGVVDSLNRQVRCTRLVDHGGPHRVVDADSFVMLHEWPAE